MNADTHVSEYQDITINTLSGLDVFFTHVRDVYHEGLKRRSAYVKKQSHVPTDDWNRQFSRVYKELQHGITGCKKALTAGKEVTTAEAKRLQMLYDRLLALRDSPPATSAKKQIIQKNSVAVPAVKNKTQNPPASPVSKKSIFTTSFHSVPTKNTQGHVAPADRKDKPVPPEKTTAPARKAPTPITFTPQSAKTRAASPPPPPAPTFIPASAKTSKHALHAALSRSSELGVVRPDPVHEKRSLTATYLHRPEYRQFISDNYSSPAGFEKIIDSTITAIESKLTDPIEQWLGEVHASPFAYLEHMTLSDINAFSQKPYEVIKSILAKENIKYEGYVLWIDGLPEMLQVVDATADMTFGELFARYLIENEMLRSE